MEFKHSASLHLALRTHWHTNGWLLARWEKCGLHRLSQTFNRGIFWIRAAILRIQDCRIQDGSSTVIVEVRLVERSHNTRTTIEPPTSQCERVDTRSGPVQMTDFGQSPHNLPVLYVIFTHGRKTILPTGIDAKLQLRTNSVFLQCCVTFYHQPLLLAS